MINFLTNSSFYALCKIASITTGMLLCMTIFYYILIHEWRVRKMMPNLKTFNSSPTLPVIGSLHHIAFNINKGATKLLQIFNHYKLPLVGWIVRSPFVAVGSYEDIQIVMNNSLERDFLGLLRKVATNSTLLLQGEQWQKSRHIATPAFSYGAMQQYIPVFNEYASFLVKKLQQFSNNNEAIEITNHVFSMNIDATIQNMTGYKLRSLETENTEVIKLLFKLLQMESMRFAFPPLFPEFMYKIYLFFSGKDKLYKKIHAISKKILKDKLNQYEMNKKREKNQDTHETDDQDSKSLINLLLKVHKIDATLTEKHIRDELIIMITLGYESISLTVCAMLLMLAMNPDIQAKVYNEIVTVLGEDENDVQYEDTKKLVYTEQCIKETLRKFTVLPFTLRRIEKDLLLSDQQVIPAGCLALVSFFTAHHDERIFPNADNWDPEHFSAEAIGQQNTQVFFPFGAGLRTCLGKNYAMISMKIQLVHLLRRYRVTTDIKMQDINWIWYIALRIECGYWLKFWSRKRTQ